MKSFKFYTILGVVLLILFFVFLNTIIIRFDEIAWTKPFVTAVILAVMAIVLVIGILLTVMGILDWLEEIKAKKEVPWKK